VFSVPFGFKCSACGREPTAVGWGLCALCGGFFCGDHLVVKKGVSTCESCAVEREQREASGGVSAEDETRVVSLLRADVEATIGSGHDEAIIQAAARRRLYADVPVQYVGDVVDEVQQYIHDAFVDTSGPRVRIIRTTRCGSRTGGGAANGSKSPSPGSGRSLA
jgi:hypothetical protein